MVHKVINSILLLFIVSISFAQGNFMFNQHGFLSAEIDTGTYINIFFDNSGSMGSTYTPLVQMRDNYLQDSLIGFYNNDINLYNEKVNVFDFRDINPDSVYEGLERIFAVLNYDIEGTFSSTSKKVVNIGFQDEASPYNADGSTYPTITPTSEFIDDITALRDSTSYYINTLKYTGIIFQVNYHVDGFKGLMQAVENGTDCYTGDYGLSDRTDQFVFYYDITDGDTAEYYTNLLMQALRDLGFDL